MARVEAKEYMHEFRTTTWQNPLDVPQTVIVREGPGQVFKFTIAPGEAREIPSQYDRAIQVVRDGIIVGGLGPRLVRKPRSPDEQTPLLHPALDPEIAARKQAEGAAVALAKQAVEMNLATAALSAAKPQVPQKK